MPEPLATARHYLTRAQLTGDRHCADIALVAAILALVEELRRLQLVLDHLQPAVGPMVKQ